VSRHVPRSTLDRRLTSDELVAFWLTCDEPLSPDELNQLWRRRTPRFLVIARCLTGVIIATGALSIGWLLRIVGGA
jgi:hypothetical protein